MGKSKNDQSLTHEEIWDDSALVHSWDEAVEEYKVRKDYLSRDRYLTDIVDDSSITAYMLRARTLKMS